MHFAHLWCNSCGVKYASQRADTIKSIVLDFPHRHVVLTIADKLRQFFQYDRNLLNLLFSAATDTLYKIFDSFGKKDDHFKAAFIITLHTFGRDLKWNPHVHILLADGYIDEANVFHRLKFISYTALRKRWMTTLLYALRDHIDDKYKYLLKRITNILYKKYDNGFYVYAPPTKYKNVDDAVDYVVRYVGRPVMAQSRITDYDPVNKNVSYWYERHDDGVRVDVCESVIDFMKKLILHISDNQFKMIRYYGIYASVKRKTRSLVKVMTQRLFRAPLFKKN
ncbi:transposase [[Eubacterium] hominis]|uniref:IS91 family transposase n=1 Tax=[Eubacterium] hominis TaxID=2764325 RepID=UPI003A4E0A4F